MTEQIGHDQGMSVTMKLMNQVLDKAQVALIQADLDLGTFQVVTSGAGTMMLPAKGDDLYAEAAKLIGSRAIHAGDRQRAEQFVESLKRAQQPSDVARHTFSVRKRGGDGKGYEWISIDVMFPDDFGPMNRRVLFVRHLSGCDSRDLEEMTRIMPDSLRYVLRVDLAADTYTVLKDTEGAGYFSSAVNGQASGWVNYLLTSGQICADDVDRFVAYTDLGAIRDRMERTADNITLRYRRMRDGEYRWTEMQISPSSVYTQDTPVVIVTVRDAQEELAPAGQGVYEEISLKDALTGLGSRYAYQSKLRYLSHAGLPVGVIYADMNGLAVTNKTEGRVAGDKRLVKFGAFLASQFRAESCYRLGGDEFTVLIERIGQESFENRMRDLHERLCSDEANAAAIGWAWTKDGRNLDLCIDRAEAEMYTDKHQHEAE